MLTSVTGVPVAVSLDHEECYSACFRNNLLLQSD